MGAPSFKTVMSDFAKFMEWDGSQIEDSHAYFSVPAESGEELDLYISMEEEVVYFDIPSEVGADDEAGIEAETARELLKRNAVLGFGSWCADEYDDGWYFAVKYTQDLETLSEMSKQMLADILGAMADEVDEFNEMLEDSEE